MAMYSAYFDESGHPDKGDYMVVAGAVADVGQWVEFEREWKEVLAPLNTEVFHATDFEAGASPFDGLSECDKDDLFSKLIGIICRRVEKTCAGTIKLNDYKAVNRKYVFAEHYGFPYPSCARTCMGAVEEWAHSFSISVKEILFIFEDGAKHKGQIKFIAERDGIPVPDFKKKTEVIALQCGDLLAWLLHLTLVENTLAPRYLKAIERLIDKAHRWRDMNLSDPDRLPSILGIPLRDPLFKYEWHILRKNGKRTVAVTRRPKTERGQFKIDRKNDVIPEVRQMPIEEFQEIAKRYDKGVLSKKNADENA